MLCSILFTKEDKIEEKLSTRDVKNEFSRLMRPLGVGVNEKNGN